MRLWNKRTRKLVYIYRYKLITWCHSSVVFLVVVDSDLAVGRDDGYVSVHVGFQSQVVEGVVAQELLKHLQRLGRVAVHEGHYSRAVKLAACK